MTNNLIFYIEYILERNRTNVRTATEGLNSCLMYNNILGYTQVCTMYMSNDTSNVGLQYDVLAPPMSSFFTLNFQLDT